MTRGNFVNHPTGEDNLNWRGGQLSARYRYRHSEHGKEKIRIQAQVWKAKNRDKWRIYHDRARLKLKLGILTHYGGGKPVCVKCGFNNERALSIDHLNGGGIQHFKQKGVGYGQKFYYWLKRNNYPEVYQTLCMNCQFIKRFENNEVPKL